MNGYISGKYEGLITKHCMESDSVNPAGMAYDIMKQKEMRMHGPEHHYLTAAVLVAAYCNEKNLVPEKAELLRKVFYRTNMLPPGACGFYGICGDVQAVGAAVSLLLKITPYSGSELKMLNEVTAKCQQRMACFKGQRCCKRATFSNVYEGAKCMNDMLGTSFVVENTGTCEFSHKNDTCNKNECQFYKNSFERERKNG
ncbi:MAG: DUF5714 domain-containing protein [Mangrovibacterium sp.]